MKALTLLAILFSLTALATDATAFATQNQLKPAAQARAPDKAAAVTTAKPEQDVIREQKPSYPLTKCIVSGEELGKDAPTIEYVVDGRLVRLCCKACVKDVEKDAAGTIRKVDAAVVAAQKRSYPLKTCAVTGEPLGDQAVDHVYGTRLVRLANAAAVVAFDRDPKAAMAKVDKALIDAQRPSYALKTCPVSNEPLEGSADMTPVDYLYGTQLVRLCCKSCIRTLEKDPAPYLKAVAAAK